MAGALVNIYFEIMGLPKMPNGGHGNWRADHARKMLWRKRVGSVLWGQVPSEPFKKAHAVFTRCSSIEPDGDNLVIGFKPVRDALKFYGIILDDKPSCLTAEYRWEKAKQKAGRIKVTVAPVIE